MGKWFDNIKEWVGIPGKFTNPELSSSQYSIVSSGDLTPEALRVWVELPEEVKYDAALEPFRQLYEKEYGESETILLHPRKGSTSKVKRLPLVKSAPVLQNNLRVVPEVSTYIDDAAANRDFQKTSTTEINHGSNKRKTSQKKIMMTRAKHYIKMTILIACWLCFTLIFMLYNEKDEVVKNSYVSPGETKYYVTELIDQNLTLQVRLSGPFMSEQLQRKLNSSQFNDMHKMEVWLERWSLQNARTRKHITASDIVSKEVSETWTIVLQEDELDFTEGELRSSVIKLDNNIMVANLNFVYAIRLQTTSNQTTPFRLSYLNNPLKVTSGVLYSCLLLCGLYGMIIFEVINRTMAAVLMSTTSLAVLTLIGERPSISEIVSWIDIETLLLLFSMMLLVSIMAETGIFDSLAVFAFQVTRGKIWPLIFLLCATTALVSTFLDNVTTVLLMAPVTIRLCEVTGLDPVPILMSMVLYSNIGGTATPVGDPPNVIISSNKVVIEAGINFTNFTLHMSLGILLVCVQTYLQLRYWHIDTGNLRHREPRQVQDLRHQISIWRRASESLQHLSKDEQVVKERLERKIRKLNDVLECMVRQTNKRACPKESFRDTLTELKEKYKIRDYMLLIKSSIATVFVIVVFFLHSIPELSRVSLGWTALLGAMLLLVLVDREDLEPVLRRVEWSTLLFFASLFVLMEALSKLGLLQFIAELTESLILSVNEGARLAVAILLILWVSGLTLAFLDNIPLTTMMVRVVTSLGTNPNLNLPLPPLIWALSFGACLGGNGTLIGASANVVCAGVAEQHGYRFTFMQFFKIGFPVMIGHLIVITGYLLICHCVLSWHL